MVGCWGGLEWKGLRYLGWIHGGETHLSSCFLLGEPSYLPAVGSPLIELYFGVLLISALCKILLVERMRASQKTPSVEERLWVPEFGMLPRVFSSFPLTASLFYWVVESCARMENELAGPTLIESIATALHSPMPSNISIFLTLLSFHDFKLHSLLISNMIQKIPWTVFLIAIWEKKDIQLVISVDESITPHIKPFDSARDSDCQHQLVCVTTHLGCQRNSKVMAHAF